MASVATFAMVWSIHDFVLPNIGNPNGLIEAIQIQAAALSDWKVAAAIAWTGQNYQISILFLSIFIFIFYFLFFIFFTS